MMGGVLPETCWASYEHGIINFATLLHLVVYFYMNQMEIVKANPVYAMNAYGAEKL
jgi:hypothetical protein